MGDALLELADVRRAQVALQLGLAEEHDLQELLALGLQVGEEPDLLEGVQRHALGLLDEHHHLAVVGVLLQEPGVQGVHHLEPPRARGQGQLHLEGDGVQDVFRREARVGEVHDLDRLRQLHLQHAADHGLAAADLADDLDDPFAAGDRVDDGVEDRAPAPAREEQPRVRRDPEGRLGETEVLVVHPRAPLRSGAGSGCRAWSGSPRADARPGSDCPGRAAARRSRSGAPTR